MQPTYVQALRFPFGIITLHARDWNIVRSLLVYHVIAAPVNFLLVTERTSPIFQHDNINERLQAC